MGTRYFITVRMNYCKHCKHFLRKIHDRFISVGMEIEVPHSITVPIITILLSEAFNFVSTTSGQINIFNKNVKKNMLKRDNLYTSGETVVDFTNLQVNVIRILACII